MSIFLGSTVPIDGARFRDRSEEHTSELQSQSNLVCRLLLEKKKIIALYNRLKVYDNKFYGHCTLAVSLFFFNFVGLDLSLFVCIFLIFHVVIVHICRCATIE